MKIKKKKLKKLMKHQAMLAAMNVAKDRLIEDLLEKIENMEEKLKKIKSDVQEVKETKEEDSNGDSSGNDV